MKLSVSNIAWSREHDSAVYGLMRENGYKGLEIAPTRVFPEMPYNQIAQAEAWAAECEFDIPSMQSIWYGKSGNIFCERECEALMEYTRKAVDFAQTIRCRNLVFGCPRNRQIPAPECRSQAVSFFREIGAYAAAHGCIIGIEANPPIYNTNFINTTQEALQFINEVNSPGVMLNLDVGTMIYNNEPVSMLKGCVDCISHVHISEPYLKFIEQRDMHRLLASLLNGDGYAGYVSIEMARLNKMELIGQVLAYVKGVFAC